MKIRLQHLLHPQNLWRLFKGNLTGIFKFYGIYCWQPLLRKLPNNDSFEKAQQLANIVCEQCNGVLDKITLPVIFWAYTERYSYCSMTCRDQWLQTAAKETPLDLLINKAAYM